MRSDTAGMRLGLLKGLRTVSLPRSRALFWVFRSCSRDSNVSAVAELIVDARLMFADFAWPQSVPAGRWPQTDLRFSAMLSRNSGTGTMRSLTGPYQGRRP